MLTTLEARQTAEMDLGAGLGMLTSLTSLSMFGLRSCVPGTFQGLQALTSLVLSGASAYMGGLGALTALKKLDLSDHKTITALPKSIGNLKWLLRLDMSHCPELLTVEALPEGLERLELWWCPKLTEIPSVAGMNALVHLDLGNCGSLRHVRGLECLTMLEYVNVSGCTSMDGRGIRIMGNRALRECHVSGSKIGVAYDNRWMEGGVSGQVICWMGNAIPLLSNGMGNEVVASVPGTSALVLECVIARDAKCISVILCLVALGLGVHPEIKVLMAGRLIVQYSRLIDLFSEDGKQVWLCTFGREHEVVQSLQQGDQIHVYFTRSSFHSCSVMEGAICVVHKEDENLILMMNSEVLEKKESQDMVLQFRKLVLEDTSDLEPIIVMSS